MPGFNPLSTIATISDRPFMTLYSLDKKERQISFPAGAPPNGSAEFVAMVEALAAASNMGLINYCLDGITTFIPDGTAVVYDEMYGSTETATLIFQDPDFDNPEVRVLLPAPNAAIFTVASGVLIDPAQSLASAAIAAIETWLNDDPATPLIANYSFVGGYLNTANSQERRVAPSIIEPTGDPDQPGT